MTPLGVIHSDVMQKLPEDVELIPIVLNKICF